MNIQNDINLQEIADSGILIYKVYELIGALSFINHLNPAEDDQIETICFSNYFGDILIVYIPCDKSKFPIKLKAIYNVERSRYIVEKIQEEI